MKKKPGFVLRKICGENIIVAEGKENIDFSKIISMNESSAYLWEKLGNEEFDTKKMAKLLTEEYEVDETTALNDATTLAKQWVDGEFVEP